MKKENKKFIFCIGLSFTFFSLLLDFFSNCDFFPKHEAYYVGGWYWQWWYIFLAVGLVMMAIPVFYLIKEKVESKKNNKETKNDKK